nr:replication initiator [Microbacterium esteraromaticum]
MTHTPDEVELRGMPIDLDDYEYEGQVRWHGALGRLWRSSVVAMRRRCADAEYFAVREVQARMALHLHVVVRVPAWSKVDAETMGIAARSAAATHPVTGELVQWGKHGVQDREIQAGPSDTEGVTPDLSRAAARIVSYVGKALGYSLKDVIPGSSNAERCAPERIAFLYRLRAAARQTVRCPDCPESGPGQCDRRAHDNLGYGGHVVTVSRPSENREGWSLSHLTRKRLREERRAWMAANRPDDVGGVSAGDIKLSKWLRIWLERHGARRARRTWEAQQYARAP